VKWGRGESLYFIGGWRAAFNIQKLKGKPEGRSIVLGVRGKHDLNRTQFPGRIRGGVPGGLSCYG